MSEQDVNDLFLLLVGAAFLWYLGRSSTLGQVGPWFPEDPTGGAYGGGGDPIYGDVLGPGESLAVAYQWLGQLKPKGFVALS